MRKIEAVIFDLDGVIVHTDYYHYLAWKSIADELCIPFDEQYNMRFRGVSRMACMEILMQDYHGTPLCAEEQVALATLKNERYREYLKGLSPTDVTVDVRNTLCTLRERGIKTAIGSSSKNAGFILEKLEIKNLFDAVSDGNNIEFSKPDPQVFLMAADFLSIEPKHAMVVEDAVSGIEAALRGGFISVAIGDAHNHPHARHRINLLSDILPLCCVEFPLN